MNTTRRSFLLTAASGAFAPFVSPEEVGAQSVNWFPLLGPASPNEPWKVTPVYGIRYNARGFDHGREKRIEVKTPNHLRKRGASHLIEDYKWLATQMVRTTEPDGYIPFQIDMAFGEIRMLWRNCGGLLGAVASAFNPRLLTVDLKATPFWSPEHGQYLNGTTDGRNIRTVAISAGKLMSDPAHAYLVSFREILLWEFGNTLSLAAGIPFTGIANEIGDRSPCELNRLVDGVEFTSPKQATA